MSGVINHIVRECMRLIREHGLSQTQMDTLVTALSLELLKLKEQNYDVLIKRLDKISQEYPKKGLAGGMPTDKEEEE